jgi:hypothetical protein
VLGIGELEVYVSHSVPYAMVAAARVTTQLVLGSNVANTPTAIRFAAGAALGLVRLALVAPAQADPVFVRTIAGALVSFAHPEQATTDPQIASAASKLRRVLTEATVAEIAREAATLDDVRPDALSADVRLASLRCGVAASGTLLPALEMISRDLSGSLRQALSSPTGAALLTFSLNLSD